MGRASYQDLSHITLKSSKSRINKPAKVKTKVNKKKRKISVVSLSLPTVERTHKPKLKLKV